MKPMNFPARKNARRLGALARAESDADVGTEKNKARRLQEIKRLRDLTGPQPIHHREVRTKKNRSASAVFGRRA